MKIIQLKNLIAKIKKNQDRLNSRMEMREERIRKTQVSKSEH